MNMVPLSRIDPDAIETLLDAAFGTDRRARTAYKLRSGTEAIAGLSFASVADNALALAPLRFIKLRSGTAAK